jgi:hypothetical protein
MAEQICPTCGCNISGEGNEKEGVVYCCEPCATGGACECACCRPMEKDTPDVAGE